jgi:hypothetical protein
MLFIDRGVAMNAANPPSFKSRWQRAIGQSDLPPTTRLVLLTVSVHFMDENGGHCYPKIADLMRFTGFSNRCVIDHLNLAVEKRWLEHWRYGRGRSNRRWNYQATIPAETVNEVHHQSAETVNEVHHQSAEIVTEVHHHSTEIVTESHHHSTEIVTEVHHKPCRDIIMKREATLRTSAREESAAATVEPAPALSEKEKNRMTALTDAVIEAAKKAIRQRGVREDLSDAALNHSIEKCRAQKGYCEMTEAAWIETMVQWVGKERIHNGSPTRLEAFSPPSPPPSPEKNARQHADYAARIAVAEAQHRQRLAGYLALQQDSAPTPITAQAIAPPTDPIPTLQALAAKVRMGASAAPAAPAQRTFGPMGSLSSSRPPLPTERREALNQILREMHSAGCSADDLTQVSQSVRDAPEDTWRAAIAQARQRLAPTRQAVAG